MKLLSTIGAALLLSLGLAASGHARPVSSSSVAAQSAEAVIQVAGKKKTVKRTAKRKKAARSGRGMRANPTGRDPAAGGPAPPKM